jgi:hypothetical protein
MLRDTLAALDQLPNALTRFRQTFPSTVTPRYPPWNCQSARRSTPVRLTTWSQSEIPKRVKHPRAGDLVDTQLLSVYEFTPWPLKDTNPSP